MFILPCLSNIIRLALSIFCSVASTNYYWYKWEQLVACEVGHPKHPHHQPRRLRPLLIIATTLRSREGHHSINKMKQRQSTQNESNIKTWHKSDAINSKICKKYATDRGRGVGPQKMQIYKKVSKKIRALKNTNNPTNNRLPSKLWKLYTKSWNHWLQRREAGRQKRKRMIENPI